jgi:hypothetical protein
MHCQNIKQLRGQTLRTFQAWGLETTRAFRRAAGGLAALLLHPLQLHALGNSRHEGFTSEWLIQSKLAYRQVNSMLINWAIDVDCRRKSYAIEIAIVTIDNLRIEFAIRAIDILPDR